MPKEPSKTRKWEQERRERLKNGFLGLSKVLPCYDPSITLCKIDVLRKAADHIVELQEKVKKLMTSGDNKEKEEVVKKLHDRIKKLLVRNEQLSNLLKDAGITVPSACGTVKKFKHPTLWSNKISAEQAKVLQKQECEKENVQNKPPPKRKTKLKNEPNCKSIKNTKSKGKRKRVIKGNKNNKCFIVFSQPSSVSQSCYIITNATSNTLVKTSTVTNSTVLSTPLVSSKSFSSTVLTATTPTISQLAPTLILTNGTLLPVLSQTTNQPTIIPQSLNALDNKSVVVVSNPLPIFNATANQNEKPTRVFPKIRPKCLTKTTMINRVPIPALTSRYANNYLILSQNAIPLANNKRIKKNVQKRKSDNSKSNKKIKLDSNLKENAEKATENETTNSQKCDKECKEMPEIIVEAQPLAKQENESKNKNETILNKDIQLGKDNESSQLKENVLEDKISSNSKSDKAIESTISTTSLNDTENQNRSEKIENLNVISCEKVQNSSTNNNTSNNNNIENRNNGSSTNKDVENIDENPSKYQLCLYSNNDDCTKDNTNKYDFPSFSDTFSNNKVNNLSEDPKSINKSSDSFSCSSAYPKKDYTNTNQKSSNPSVETDTSVSNKNKEIKDQKKIADLPTETDMKTLELNLPPSELSNDIFATLQDPSGCQNPESTSPTAAFLNAFPLVSSLNGVKVTEVIDEDNADSQRETPTLLQIGTMDSAKTTQTAQSQSYLGSSYLNLDTFSFFNSGNTEKLTEDTVVSVPNTFYNANVSNYVTSSSSTIVSSKTNVDYHSGNKINYNNSKTVSFEGNQRSNPTVNRVDMNTNHLNPSTSTVAVPKHFQSSQNKGKAEINKTPTYQTNEAYSSCNFNPNTRDTSTKTSHFPSVTTTSSTVTNNKNYPFYSNATTTINNYYNYDSFNQNYYKNATKPDRSYFNYENYTNEYSRKNDNILPQLSNHYYENYSTSNANTGSTQSKDKFSNKTKNSNQNKQPINWMTTPDNRLQPDYLLPPFTKNDFPTKNDFSYNSNSFVTTTATSMYYYNNSIFSSSENLESKKNETANNNTNILQEENQFSWSPSKIQFLDTAPHFVSSTLPTLVGDLALSSFGEQKTEKPRETTNKKEPRNRKVNYENNSSSFLVSQLVVDHKEATKPATSRRNSGNRSKSNSNSNKTKRSKNEANNTKDSGNVKVNKVYNADIFNATNSNCDKPQKNPTNYSAESLISHQYQETKRSVTTSNTNQNKSLVTSFLPDNLVPYFPPVEDNYQNQNYQQNAFSSSFQNNSYTPNTFIPPVSTSIIHHDTTSDYSDNLNIFSNTNNTGNVTLNKDKHYKNFPAPPPPSVSTNRAIANNSSEKICTNYNKKSNSKKTKHDNLPNFELPFLSMPASINSPILPDDFHTSHTNFLQPPTAPYTCKNPLYKQNPDLPSVLPPLPIPPTPRQPHSNIQHPEISPINTGTSSLTNFNLSAIFPEMNTKGHLQDGYSASKEQRNFTAISSSASTSLQMPFTNLNKPSFGFNSYPNPHSHQ